jgi:nicotinamidase-related amidase
MSGAVGGRDADPADAGWLAVIDMQRIFADPDSEWRAPRFAEIVEPVKRLAAAFADRVTFTRFIAPDVPAGAWRSYYDRWPFALQPPDSPVYELAADFGPVPTLEVTTFGKWGPELAEWVGSGRLVLAGVSTDCCVLSTALAAADAGVAVQVVADACAGATDETHKQALDIMSLYAPLIEVVRLSDILRALWSLNRARRARCTGSPSGMRWACRPSRCRVPRSSPAAAS